MQRKFNEVSKKRFWKSGSLRSKKFVTGVFWKFFKQIFLRKLPGGFFLILYLTLKVNSFKSLFARVFVKPFTGFLLLQLRNEKGHTAWRDMEYLCIQSECRKIQTRKNSVFGQFSHSDSFFKEGTVAHYSMKITSFFSCYCFFKAPSYYAFYTFLYLRAWIFFDFNSKRYLM